MAAKSEVKVPQPQENPQSTNNVDDLVSHLQQIDGLDNDIAKHIAENWQRLLGLLLVIIVGAWVGKTYQKSQSTKHQKAAEHFQALQSSFSSFDASLEPQEKKTQLEAINANIQALESNHKGSSYKELAEIYQILNTNPSSEKVSIMADESVKKLSSSITEESFIAELTLLVSAKKLIASDKSSAKNYLSTLSLQGNFAAPSAILTLARIAQTQEEKAEVKELADKLVSRKPESSNFLTAVYPLID